MKVIALLPIKNEAWVLEHTLASLSAFCDVIVVSDQHSTDGSPEICRRFPKVVMLGSPPAGEPDLPKQARWRLLDAARSYDGTNLLWWTDADELPAPRRAQAFLQWSLRYCGEISAGRRRRHHARISSTGSRKMPFIMPTP